MIVDSGTKTKLLTAFESLWWPPLTWLLNHSLLGMLPCLAEISMLMQCLDNLFEFIRRFSIIPTALRPMHGVKIEIPRVFRFEI